MHPTGKSECAVPYCVAGGDSTARVQNISSTFTNLLLMVVMFLCGGQVLCAWQPANQFGRFMD